MVETLEDERRAREANEAGDPEAALREPPVEPAEAEVLEEGVPTGTVATVVLEDGLPTPETGLTVDMDPVSRAGVDILDIASPVPPVATVVTRRGRAARGSTEGDREMKGGPAEKTPPEVLARAPAERLSARVKGRELSRRRKLAYLLSQEVRRVVEDLGLRQNLLIDVWSRMRVRQPLLNVIRTRYEELQPDDLLLLPVECLEHLDRFYRVVDELRLYLQTTEDMPTALEISYERFRLALSQIARPLLFFLDSTHEYEDALPAMMPRGGEILE